MQMQACSVQLLLAPVPRFLAARVGIGLHPVEVVLGAYAGHAQNGRPAVHVPDGEGRHSGRVVVVQCVRLLPGGSRLPLLRRGGVRGQHGIDGMLPARGRGQAELLPPASQPPSGRDVNLIAEKGIIKALNCSIITSMIPLYLSEQETLLSVWLPQRGQNRVSILDVVLKQA